MYPIKFENIYFNKIWGGRAFSLFRNNLPEGKIGESWDVACRSDAQSIIANGCYKGLTLGKLIEMERENILGTEIRGEKFPLLLKLINAADTLSVQVHPDDIYARLVENDMGKTECWYIVEAAVGASIIIGTKNCNQDIFRKAINEGKVEEFLNKIPVNKGEFYFVPSGMVHAIGSGVIIAEIQQNSDLTYRLYDYKRGRELHIEKALDVIDFELKGENIHGIVEMLPGLKKTRLVYCNKFVVELYEIKDSVTERSNYEKFYLFTAVEGFGCIIYNKGVELLKQGDSFMIPASLGTYTIKGNITLLKTYIPTKKLKY
jgi:mannose-6-phosphate isomerase